MIGEYFYLTKDENFYKEIYSNKVEESKYKYYALVGLIFDFFLVIVFFFAAYSNQIDTSRLLIKRHFIQN